MDCHEPDTYYLGISTFGDILFADSLHHYNFQQYADEHVLSLAVWD